MSNFNVAKLGEDFACKYLVKNGYKILARNFRKPFGELDIVALKDKTLVFVEVKTFYQEKENFKPEDEMTRKKIENFKKISNYYFNKHFNLIKCENMRLDLLVIFLKENKIRHYENVIG